MLHVPSSPRKLSTDALGSYPEGIVLDSVAPNLGFKGNSCFKGH